MLHVLWKNALIEGVRCEGNPQARRDVEAALRAAGIVRAGETLLRYDELSDFRRAGAESYGADFSVAVGTAAGPVARRVYVKAIVTGFGREATATAVRCQVARLRLLAGWGIPTPEVYGHGDGTIYEEFVAGDPLVPRAWRGGTEPARIAAVLDFRGARPLDFIADLLAAPDGSLRYVDAGSDLGHIEAGLPPNRDRPALRALRAAFPAEARAAMEAAYASAYDQLPGNRLGGAS